MVVAKMDMAVEEEVLLGPPPAVVTEEEEEEVMEEEEQGATRDHQMYRVLHQDWTSVAGTYTIMYY